MNKLIREQLEQVRSTEINYDNETTKIFIPKTTKVTTKALNIGEVYKIEVYGKTYIAELLGIVEEAYKWNGVNENNSRDNLYEYVNKKDFKIIGKI